MENKNSFFSLYLDIRPFKENDFYLEKLDDSVDLIFSSMGVRNHCYKFKEANNNEFIYFFQTDNRKRKGQLVKYCEKYLPENQDFSVDGITKFNFETEIERTTKNNNFKLIEKPNVFGEYSANDISIFNDPKNWHSWQKEVYKLIFNEDNSFKKPHPRQIISIVDTKGNSGKSSFFKWLYYNHPNSIGRMGYGSASQLRSGSVNLGKKNLYIIDLARSKSKDDRQEDLLSVLEDLKSGLITNAMYGSGKTLLMEPPHIIVSSNYVLKYELLSSDRWQVYKIGSSNNLKPLKIGEKSIKK